MVNINSLACTICVLVVILYAVLYRDHIEIMKRVIQSKLMAEYFEIIIADIIAEYSEIIKVTAEGAFEIMRRILYTPVPYRDHNIYIEFMKREVQRKVTAECAFKIMKRAAAFEIMKGKDQSKITAECAFEIMKRVVQSKVTAECAFEIIRAGR